MTERRPSPVLAASAEEVDVAALEQAVRDLPDPEIPVITIDDLGIVRGIEVDLDRGHARVTITPTYSGCPALEAIAGSVRRTVERHGLSAEVLTRLSPAWSTDWMSESGRESLRRFGIAPPGPSHHGSGPVPLELRTRRVACPQCGSGDTEELARFGSTACKALRRCRQCREPFEEFKAI